MGVLACASIQIIPLRAAEQCVTLGAAQIDMPFTNWMTGHSLTGLPPSDDSDGDGISAAVEFALGLNPSLRDSNKVRSGVFDYGAGPVLARISHTQGAAERVRRCPCADDDEAIISFHRHFMVSAIMHRRSLNSSCDAASCPDGLARAWLPATDGRGFLRLETVIAP